MEKIYVIVSDEKSCEDFILQRVELREFVKEKMKQIKEKKKKFTKEEYYSWLDKEYKAIILLELLYWKEMMDVEAYIPFLLKGNVLKNFETMPSGIEKNSEYYLYHFSGYVLIDWRYLKIINKLVKKIRKKMSL